MAATPRDLQLQVPAQPRKKVVRPPLTEQQRSALRPATRAQPRALRRQGEERTWREKGDNTEGGRRGEAGSGGGQQGSPPADTHAGVLLGVGDHKAEHGGSWRASPLPARLRSSPSPPRRRGPMSPRPPGGRCPPPQPGCSGSAVRLLAARRRRPRRAAPSPEPAPRPSPQRGPRPAGQRRPGGLQAPARAPRGPPAPAAFGSRCERRLRLRGCELSSAPDVRFLSRKVIRGMRFLAPRR